MNERDRDTETLEQDAARAEGVEPSVGAAPQDDRPAEPGGEGEADILREELAAAREQLEEAQRQSEEMQDRFLRARADLENYRRRAEGDRERAREAGLDMALLTVMEVYDDLLRALQVAETGDPASIVPGVRQVSEGLERRLEALGIARVGEVGDDFDPDVHEALSTVPTDNPEQQGRIAEVFQAGFRKGERLVRPARVLVYQQG